jgi:hypothetical protein
VSSVRRLCRQEITVATSNHDGKGWEPSQLATTSKDSLERQEAVSAIKDVLASFCVIDEERRFELFQLSARLEARWALALPPALMHAITELTEQALYKRALEPYLLREHIIESEGEFVRDAQWMVQEVPKANDHVLLLVTNRAIYLLETSRLGGVCQVCESWKLCPSGPKLVRKVALYKVSRVTIDFTALYGAGHRIKIHLTGDLSDTFPLMSIERATYGCGAPAGCCEVRDKAIKAAEVEGDKGGTLATRRPITARACPSGELQFSSLYAGVVQRMANVIRSEHPRGQQLPVFRDTYAPRAIQTQRAQRSGGSRKANARTALPVEHLPPFQCLVALRVEQLGAGGKTLRLMLVTGTHVELYAEKPDLFGVPLMIEQDTSSFSGKDGLDCLALKEAISIDNLSTLELEMSAEPRARLAESGGKLVLLEFADDTGAMLFRHHMRQALWGRGRVGWTSASLGGQRA